MEAVNRDICVNIFSCLEKDDLLQVRLANKLFREAVSTLAKQRLTSYLEIVAKHFFSGLKDSSKLSINDLIGKILYATPQLDQLNQKFVLKTLYNYTTFMNDINSTKYYKMIPKTELIRCYIYNREDEKLIKTLSEGDQNSDFYKFSLTIKFVDNKRLEFAKRIADLIEYSTIKKRALRAIKTGRAIKGPASINPGVLSEIDTIIALIKKGDIKSMLNKIRSTENNKHLVKALPQRLIDNDIKNLEMVSGQLKSYSYDLKDIFNVHVATTLANKCDYEEAINATKFISDPMQRQRAMSSICKRSAVYIRFYQRVAVDRLSNS